MRSSACLVLACLPLSARPAAQFAGLNWTTSGTCAAADASGIQLGVCTTCSYLGTASAVLATSGWYRLDYNWSTADDCCSHFLVRVNGVTMHELWNGFGALCPGAPPCNDSASALFPAQAGDTLELRLINTACFNALTTLQATSLTLVPAQPPQLTGFQPATATAPSVYVFLTGTYLAASAQAQFDGIPVPVIAGSFSKVVLDVGHPAPGPHVATVTTPYGSDTFEVWLTPWLRATAGAPGGVLSVEHDLPSFSGPFALGLGSATLAAPLGLGPDIYHGLLLDPQAPFVILMSGPSYFGGHATLPFAIPPDASLTGAVFHVQALSVGNQFLPPLYSFTNAATFVIL